MRGSSSLARAEAGRRRGTRGLGAVAGLVAGAWRPDAGLLVAVAGAPHRGGSSSRARVEAGRRRAVSLDAACGWRLREGGDWELGGVGTRQ